MIINYKDPIDILQIKRLDLGSFEQEEEAAGLTKMRKTEQLTTQMVMFIKRKMIG